jgi:NADH-quinone oxidoreductase subunit H
MLFHPLAVQTILILIKIVCLLIAIAYYTIAERKIMAAVQRRRGPNVVGFWGLLQPLADGLKLIAKELVIPTHANNRLFFTAPLVILTLGLLTWSIIPFDCVDSSERFSQGALIRALLLTAGVANYDVMYLLTEMSDIADLRYGLLLILALSSLTVYGIIIAGWASNSKYAFLGALRSAAQMISYEVSISITLLPVIILSGSLNLTRIVLAQEVTGWYARPLFAAAIIFFISSVAETNRTPFDLPEAEAELVAGYNVEYSSIVFSMFFLAEYGNMVMISLLNALLFMGGWSSTLATFLPPAFILTLRGLFFCFLFVLIRAALPRYRYDQLMDIGWKVFLPVTTGLLLLTAGIVMSLDVAPVVFELSLGSESTF